MTVLWTDQLENTGSSLGNFFFKIDDTFFFLIDNTYKLIIDSGSSDTIWTDQSEA